MALFIIIIAVFAYLVLTPGYSSEIDREGVPEVLAGETYSGSSRSMASRWEKGSMIAGDGEIVGLSAELEMISRAGEKEFSYRLNGYFKLLSSGSGSVVAWVHYLDQNGEELWSSPLTFDIPKGAKMGDYVAIQELHQSYGDPPPVAEILLELELVNIKETASPMLPKSLKVFPEKLNQKYFLRRRLWLVN